MNQIKLKRIGSQILQELSQICFQEANDELLKTITITGVDVTNDLSFAKVYFTSLLDKSHKSIEKDLNDNTAGYLRTLLAGRIDLRHTPKLVFKYDDSIAYGNNIENIIEEIHEKE